MAMLCPEYNLLYLMAPRTGCTAVEDTLEKQLGGQLIPPQDILDDQGNFILHRRHHSLQAMLKHKLIAPEKAASMLKFSCIRNPFDSLASDYVKRASKYQHYLEDPNSWVHRLPGYVEDMHFCTTHSFDDWVEKHYGAIYSSSFQRSMQTLADGTQGRGNRVKKALGLRTQPYTMYGDYTTGMDVVMRFETLQADFDKVLEQAGVPFKVTIPVINKTEERTANYREYYTQKSRQIVQYIFRYELKRYDYQF